MPSFNKAVSILLMVARLGAAANLVTTEGEHTQLHHEGERVKTRNLRGPSSDKNLARQMNEAEDNMEIHRSLVSTDVTIYSGLWGHWTSFISDEEEDATYYACGAEMRVEMIQGGGENWDDTAANGLKLQFCHVDNWSWQSTKIVREGNWGSWRGMQMCPHDKWISGAQVRFEDNQRGGDDTALNGLKIFCADKNGGKGEWKLVDRGYWGNWKPQVTKPGMAVRAASVRFENDQGGKGDDTAWNGLKFEMVPFDHNIEELTVYNGLWGEWKGWRGPNKAGMYACGAQVRLEGEQEQGDDTAANGLTLKFCDIDDWSNQDSEVIYDGHWGDWGDMKMCPENTWITGARVRFEGRQGSKDDTALNGLEILCSNGEQKMVEDGKWGDWKDWVNWDGKFVTEANIRFEDKQHGGDDTAWNGLKFRVGTPHSG